MLAARGSSSLVLTMEENGVYAFHTSECRSMSFGLEIAG